MLGEVTDGVCGQITDTLLCLDQYLQQARCVVPVSPEDSIQASSTRSSIYRHVNLPDKSPSILQIVFREWEHCHNVHTSGIVAPVPTNLPAAVTSIFLASVLGFPIFRNENPAGSHGTPGSQHNSKSRVRCSTLSGGLPLTWSLPN